jgi:predicted GIY-YIG superfamily endonuclease
MPFYCYMLRCADGSYYVGASDDLDRRLKEHNNATAADRTAERRPVKLVWSEPHESLSSARTRENQLKHWSHAKKSALVGGSPRPAAAGPGQGA